MALIVLGACGTDQGATVATPKVPERPLGVTEPSSISQVAGEEPGSITLDEPSVAQGSTISVRFHGPLARMHGGYFYLLNEAGDQVAALWSGGNGGEPGSTTDLDDLTILDYGIQGAGPDVLVLPATIGAGNYTLCTAHNRPYACTALQIV
jgi:hypothetical protein